ncbi:hypothetical protein HQ576_04595, partial [bacterium]|nr:hypothetical protein [bacterium]
MRTRAALIAILALLVGTGCCLLGGGPKAGSFGDDLAFLKQHTDVVVLSDRAGNAQVAVVPLYQGRVMTTTATGERGLSFGWMNRDLVASGERLKGMNPFGGEDRIWFGPEGGQFALFFKKGDPFDLKHWQTPAAIDWGGWDVVSKTDDALRCRTTASLVNYSGTRFDLTADRTVRLLSTAEARLRLGVKLGRGVKLVAYESVNRITNTGKQAWEKKTGLLSIWILCMYNPSPHTVAIIPYQDGPEAQLGPVVNDAYFGKVPADRLVAKDGTIFFKCDGKHRGKIGVSPKRAKPILGSYDAANRVLTLAQYTKPEGATDYVNSMWEIQKAPYAGDVVNSYNDGPAADGSMLGPFWEIESSSPAA